MSATLRSPVHRWQATRSLEIRERLLTQNPDSAQVARDVMVSRYTLGEFELKRERFDEAITQFQKGIEVLDVMLAKRLNEAAT